MIDQQNINIKSIASAFVGAIFFLVSYSCEEDLAKTNSKNNKNFLHRSFTMHTSSKEILDLLN